MRGVSGRDDQDSRVYSVQGPGRGQEQLPLAGGAGVQGPEQPLLWGLTTDHQVTHNTALSSSTNPAPGR